jgi:hypothetical protein
LKMSWFAYSYLKYLVPASIFTGWIILLWSSQSMIPDPLPIIGFGVLLVAILVYDKHGGAPYTLWDEENGIMALLKRWSVEVSSIRLFGNVPLGIDLTHSAERVLEAMSLHYGSDDDCELKFFFTRPLSQDATRVGFCVLRRRLRLLNGISTAEYLKEKLLVDVELLESAMRASYPHVAILSADVHESWMINSGGVAVVT